MFWTPPSRLRGTADLLVAIGTTLTVMPVAGLADMAKRLAIVNAETTAYDAQADVVVRTDRGRPAGRPRR